MYNVRKVKDDLFWVGANDRRISLFENVYPVPTGVSYNSYVLMDEKTVLMDTVDSSASGVFFENLEHVLAGRPLDYIVVQHMEPDHSATLQEAARRYPDAKVVVNAKTVKLVHQFFDFDLDSRAVMVQEGDVLSTGRHNLTFVMAPMVHWPEVMVTYDLTDKLLFSADAFGTFGALGGNIFADEVPFETLWLDEARRYYTNIVGKYGPQVQALLKKAATLEISMILPLHGPVWRENIGWFVDKYLHWSSYTPEEDAVLVVYGSIYGGTQAAAEILAGKIADRGVKNVKVYDVSMTHPSYLVSEAFRCSHIVLASATYNAGIFQPMETLLHDLVAHNVQKRTVSSRKTNHSFIYGCISVRVKTHSLSYDIRAFGLLTCHQTHFIHSIKKLSVRRFKTVYFRNSSRNYNAHSIRHIVLFKRFGYRLYSRRSLILF